MDRHERDQAITTIQREAHDAGWHTLSNQAKSVLYQDWSARFDLKRTAIKDQIMKGFDAAQHIPPTGEAAVHERLRRLLKRSNVPYWEDKKSLWSGRAFADFVFGFSNRWVAVTAELESATLWQRGLQQSLWYRSAYFNETGLQALPGLLLFGDVTQERWNEIKTTCITLGVLLFTFDLKVDGEPADYALEELLAV